MASAFKTYFLSNEINRKLFIIRDKLPRFVQADRIDVLKRSHAGETLNNSV